MRPDPHKKQKKPSGSKSKQTHSSAVQKKIKEKSHLEGLASNYDRYEDSDGLQQHPGRDYMELIAEAGREYKHSTADDIMQQPRQSQMPSTSVNNIEHALRCFTLSHLLDTSIPGYSELEDSKEAEESMLRYIDEDLDPYCTLVEEEASLTHIIYKNTGLSCLSPSSRDNLCAVSSDEKDTAPLTTVSTQVNTSAVDSTVSHTVEDVPTQPGESLNVNELEDWLDSVLD